MKPDGSTGYARSGYIPSDWSNTPDDFSISWYCSASPNNSGVCDLGCADGGSNIILFQTRNGSATSYNMFGTSGGENMSLSFQNTTGFHTLTRKGLNDFNYYYGASLQNQNTTTRTKTLPTRALMLGAMDNGTPGSFGNRTHGLTLLGGNNSGLTAAQITVLSAINARYQTLMSR